MQEEVWRGVVGCEKIYKVSNLGRVKSLNRITKTNKGCRNYKGKVLKPTHDGFGYCVYGLSINGKVINKRAHQLVAIAFLNHTPCGLKLVVDHMDGNPKNNNVTNLQLITHRLNISKSRKGSSDYTGVTWHKVKKSWMSSIKYEKKTYYLGYYDCEIKASDAYNNKLKELLNG